MKHLRTRLVLLLALLLCLPLSAQAQFKASGRVILTGTSVDASKQIVTAYFSAVAPQTGPATGQFFLTQLSRTVIGSIDKAEVLTDPTTHLTTGAVMHAKVGADDAQIVLSYTPTHVLTYTIFLHHVSTGVVEVLTPGSNWRPGLVYMQPATG